MHRMKKTGNFPNRRMPEAWSHKCDGEMLFSHKSPFKCFLYLLLRVPLHSCKRQIRSLCWLRTYRQRASENNKKLIRKGYPFSQIQTLVDLIQLSKFSFDKIDRVRNLDVTRILPEMPNLFTGMMHNTFHLTFCQRQKRHMLGQQALKIASHFEVDNL